MAGTVNRSLPGKVDGCLAAALALAVRPALHGLRRARHRRPRPVRRLPRRAALAGRRPAGDVPCRCPQAGQCGQCLQAPPPLDDVHAVFDYAFPLDRLLPRLKFHRDLAAGRRAGAVHGRTGWPTCRGPDALIPIPLHRARLRSRGYDQALELARPLARALRPAAAGRCVAAKRRRPTAQSRLDADARQRNLRGAFDVVSAASSCRRTSCWSTT